jgi:hypothetical protein
MFSVLMFQLQCAVQSGFRNSGISLGKKGKIIVVCKILGVSYQEGGGDPINQFNPATFVVPVLSQDLDFQCHMCCGLFFVFSEFS